MYHLSDDVLIEKIFYNSDISYTKTFPPDKYAPFYNCIAIWHKFMSSRKEYTEIRKLTSNKYYIAQSYIREWNVATNASLLIHEHNDDRDRYDRRHNYDDDIWFVDRKYHASLASSYLYILKKETKNAILAVLKDPNHSSLLLPTLDWFRIIIDIENFNIRIYDYNESSSESDSDTSYESDSDRSY
jgi:hypothetical protein